MSIPSKKKRQPSKLRPSTGARARQAMLTLGITTLYGTADGFFFRTLEAAAAYNSGATSSLITYSLD